MPLPRGVKLALIWLGYFTGSLPLMFLVACSAIYLFFFNAKQTVDPHDVPARFPVVVITRGTPVRPNENLRLEVPLERKLKSGDVASVVLYPSLPDFTAQYDSYSYLVPANEVAELDDAMRTDPKSQEHVFAGIDVKAAGTGREEIALDASLYDDDTNKSWYEATDHAITPQRYHSHNDLGLGMASGFAAGIPALLLSLITASWMTWKKSRAPRPKAVPAAAGPGSA